MGGKDRGHTLGCDSRYIVAIRGGIGERAWSTAARRGGFDSVATGQVGGHGNVAPAGKGVLTGTRVLMGRPVEAVTSSKHCLVVDGVREAGPRPNLQGRWAG